MTLFFLFLLYLEGTILKNNPNLKYKIHKLILNSKKSSDEQKAYTYMLCVNNINKDRDMIISLYKEMNDFYETDFTFKNSIYFIHAYSVIKVLVSYLTTDQLNENVFKELLVNQERALKINPNLYKEVFWFEETLNHLSYLEKWDAIIDLYEKYYFDKNKSLTTTLVDARTKFYYAVAKFFLGDQEEAVDELKMVENIFDNKEKSDLIFLAYIYAFYGKDIKKKDPIKAIEYYTKAENFLKESKERNLPLKNKLSEAKSELRK